MRSFGFGFKDLYVLRDPDASFEESVAWISDRTSNSIKNLARMWMDPHTAVFLAPDPRRVCHGGRHGLAAIGQGAGALTDSARSQMAGRGPDQGRALRNFFQTATPRITSSASANNFNPELKIVNQTE